MNNPFITINNNKVELPHGIYTARNAQAILLSGHIHYLIKQSQQSNKLELNASKEDQKKIVSELETVECWLFYAINAMGELISAADAEQLEDNTLNNAGYLVSTLTEFIQSVQQIRREVISCQLKIQEVEK